MLPLGTTTEFSAVAGGATTDTTIRRSGTAALTFAAASSGYVLTTGGLNRTGAVQRAYILLSGTPTAAGRIMGLTSTTGHLASLSILTNRKLQLNLNGPTATALATSTFTIPTGSFDQRCELWVDRTNKIVAASYNGIEWARVQVTAFADPNTINAGWFGPDQNALGCVIHYDDMGINSLDGVHNTGWCGPSGGGVLTFWPSQTSQETAWTVINAPSIHEALDESMPDDYTTYIRETAGVVDAAAGFYFPVWPLRTPASCVLFGMRGGGLETSFPKLVRLQFHDAADQVAASANVSFNVNGWMTVYPMLTLEEAVDGTRRMLCNGYLSTTHPGLQAIPGDAGSRARAVILRASTLAVEIHVTSVWMTVDFPLSLSASVVPVPTPTPQILTTLDP